MGFICIFCISNKVHNWSELHGINGMNVCGPCNSWYYEQRKKEKEVHRAIFASVPEPFEKDDSIIPKKQKHHQHEKKKTENTRDKEFPIQKRGKRC